MKIFNNDQMNVIYDIINEQKKRISEQELLIERLKDQVKNLEMKLEFMKRWNDPAGDDIDFPNPEKDSEDRLF